MRVLHATEKVINLLTDQDRLISLVSAPIGNGPHNIVLPLDHFDTAAGPDQQAYLDAGHFHFNGFEIELETARVWNPRPDWSQIKIHKDNIHQAIPTMVSMVRSLTPDPGVGVLLGGYGAQEPNLNDHFVQALLQPAGNLVSGLRDADVDLAQKSASKLIGLGTGLTPAGDDFLAGALLACWTDFSSGATLQFLPQVVKSISGRTTRLSRAYLRSAAEGEFSEIWHVLIQSLVTNDELTWKSTLKEIVQIGHNSGAYTLAGFVKALAP